MKIQVTEINEKVPESVSVREWRKQPKNIGKMVEIIDAPLDDTGCIGKFLLLTDDSICLTFNRTSIIAFGNESDNEYFVSHNISGTITISV